MAVGLDLVMRWSEPAHVDVSQCLELYCELRGQGGVMLCREVAQGILDGELEVVRRQFDWIGLGRELGLGLEF